MARTVVCADIILYMLNISMHTYALLAQVSRVLPHRHVGFTGPHALLTAVYSVINTITALETYMTG